jgi:hypothetical protein
MFNYSPFQLPFYFPLVYDPLSFSSSAPPKLSSLLAGTDLVELAECLYCEDGENDLDCGQWSLSNHLLVCLERLVALG